MRGKTIIAMADSEGAPHRGDGKSSLWDLCVLLKYIVYSDTFETVEECNHTFQFSMPKYLTRNVVKNSLKVHFEALNHMRLEYGCENICFCFWNSPHDMSVLRYYDLGNISSVDLLAVAKKATNNKYDSYKIGELCKRFNITTQTKLHSGMGDVIRMTKLLPKLNITNTEMLHPFIKNTLPNPLAIGDEFISKSKTKPKPRNVQTSLGRVRGDRTPTPHKGKNIKSPLQVGGGLQKCVTNADIAKSAIEFARKLKL
jgi:hypothetical protein